MIAGSEGGVFIYYDQVDNWQEESYANQYFRKDALQAIETKDSITFIGTIEKIVCRSTNNELTWNYLLSGII
jgi:hypothetical protein